MSKPMVDRMKESLSEWRACRSPEFATTFEALAKCACEDGYLKGQEHGLGDAQRIVELECKKAMEMIP